MTDKMERLALRLSDRFDRNCVGRDGEFVMLDQSDASEAGALVYGAQLNFLNQALENDHVSAVIVSPELSDRVAKSGKAYVVSTTPRLDFFRLYHALTVEGWLAPPVEPGRGEGCRVHPDATVSEKASLGDRVTVEAGARIGDYTVLGDDVFVGQNAVVGADGLMPVIDEEGQALRFSHAGYVSIGNRSVILAGSCLVRSVFRRPTLIGTDTYVGLLTNIGHDVSIGTRCVIGGNCVIAGGSRIGDRVEIWASCSLVQGCRVGDGAKVHMGSVVVKDVADGESVSGNYAYSHRKHAMDHLRDQK